MTKGRTQNRGLTTAVAAVSPSQDEGVFYNVAMGVLLVVYIRPTYKNNKFKKKIW